jgi:hypothetical protein
MEYPDFSSKVEGLECSKQVSPIALEETRVKEGLEFMLSHFSEPLFPRMIARTAVNRRQYEVGDRDIALYYYKAALYEDCRISAFGINQMNPDLIFIDLDARDFVSMRALKTARTRTLNRIKNKLNGQPTVCWSGRGYHIIQPIDCPINLDEIEKFAALTNDGDVNKMFLQFAERYLTGNNNDDGHHASIKSCLLRVPGSFNSRCKAAGIDAEVEIVQRWNGFRPNYQLLIGPFYADLVGKNQALRSKFKSTEHFVPGSEYGRIEWIEKLLQTPIDDFRKRSRDLILVPYLVVRRGMTDVDQITQIIMQWADKCGQLYRLEPSRREYEKRIRSRTYEVMRDRIPPMRLETLLKKNLPMFNNSSVDRKSVVGLSTENNTDANKKKKEVAQKDSTLQPITRVNTKLDRELQEWEVESTKGGANDGGG